MIRPARAQWTAIVALLPFLLAWGLLLQHLSIPWSLAPNYRFGWLVPALALYFLHRRWASAAALSSGPNPGAFPAALVCALLLLPVWWVRVAAPDWSVVSYALAGLVTGWTFFLFAWRGGWRFAGHFASPIFLILCAVPWPQRIEIAITQSLSRWVATMTVEMLQWTGIAAERAGNLISLSNGPLEVSSACSGVRSLQAMLMVSLVLGEVRQLSIARRTLLIASGLALALGFNVWRNYFLSVVAYSRGLEAVDQWHDAAGLCILLLSTLLLVYVSGRWMAPRAVEPTEARAVGPALRSYPLGMSAGFAAWFLVIAAGTEAWYRGHEDRAMRTSRLAIAWPADRTDFHFQQIPDDALNLLVATEARAASWKEAPDSRWILAAVRWAPGESCTQAARLHFPDVCLPAVGNIFVRDLPDTMIPVRGGALRFRVSEFVNRGTAIYVLYCLHEESNRDQNAPGLRQDWSGWSRIQRALVGQRNLGQQNLTLAIVGGEDVSEALRQVTRRLPDFVALVPAPGR